MFHRGKGKPHPRLRLHHILQQAIEDIDHITEELVKIKNEYDEHVIDLQTRTTSFDVFPKSDNVIIAGASSQHASHSEDLMVGKKNEFQTIKRLLIEHLSNQREVISIKGMGGIGKTTLTRQIYGDSSVVSHFDKRAWVVVSQFHNKKQMLVCLLNSFEQGKAESSTVEDLAENLYRCLKGQRYLIVMDDVWSRGAWDDVNACFPDDRNGSRVLLTTRLEEVANQVSCNIDFSHQMHLLDQNESWDLFHEKVMLNGISYSGEFEMIGRSIVEKCRGLPLAIVVAAGLFSKLNTLDEWKNIAKALNSFTTTIAEACSRILSLSYNHLPHNLKSCFLYLGIFPEDEEIDANNLARLWAAEGIVKAFQNESFQPVAERHLQELKDRNLIIKSEPSSNGRKIKRFRTHDVLHAFCVKEAQKENLLQIVSKNNSNFSQKGCRWISLQCSKFDVLRLYSSSKNCRSILSFSKVTHLKLQNFNVLRVFYDTTDDICNLLEVGKFRKVTPIHLRYLSSSIVKFRNSKQLQSWNLQTLVKARIDSLDFPQLCYCSCDWLPYWGITPNFVLQNLQSIQISVGSDSSECTEKLFTNIPCLKKLCIHFYVFPEYTIRYIRFIDNFAYLQQVESLKICIFHTKLICSLTGKIALLKTLKKLSFLYSNLRWEEMNVLSMLPRLEVLKLGRYACEGGLWKLGEEDKFRELIFLKFDELDLVIWEACDYHFPKLQSLLVNDCNLEEIPNGFADISTLKLIELRRCLPSAVISAKQIQDGQHDQGNDEMIVIEK